MKKFLGFGSLVVLAAAGALSFRGRGVRSVLTLSAVEKQSLRDAPNENGTGRSDSLFEPFFRAVVGKSGRVLVDKNIYVAPGPDGGEAKYWNSRGIRLQNAPADVLSRKQAGGRYEDQYGGTWTVRRIKVALRNKRTSCDEPPGASGDDARCYFLVPEFGGYATNASGRIVGLVSWNERNAIVKKEQDGASKDLAKLHAAGYLTPPEMIGTPMFARLEKAVAPYVDARAVKERALNPADFPHYVVSGGPGSWEVVFMTENQGPKTLLGKVPGRALEAAGFGFSAKYGTITDPGNRRIKDVATLGIDRYVVERAFQNAYEADLRAAERRHDAGLMRKVHRELGL